MNFRNRLYQIIAITILVASSLLPALAVEDPSTVDLVGNNRKNATKLELSENEDGNLTASGESTLDHRRDKDFFEFLVPENNMELHLESTSPAFIKFYKGRKRLAKKRDADNNIVVKLKKRGVYHLRSSKKFGRKFVPPQAYDFKITLFSKEALKGDEPEENPDGDENPGGDGSPGDDGIRAIPIGKVVEETLDSPDDIACFKFTIGKDKEDFYAIELLQNDPDTSFDESGNIIIKRFANLTMRLFDSSENEIATSKNVIDHDGFSSGTLRKINRFLTPGTYTIKLSVNLNTPGVFRLVVREPDGRGNGTANASELELNGSMKTGDIDYPGDTDYFRIGKLAPGNYNLKFTSKIINDVSVNYKIPGLGGFFIQKLTFHNGGILSDNNINLPIFDFQDPDLIFYLQVGRSTYSGNSHTGPYSVQLSN